MTLISSVYLVVALLNAGTSYHHNPVNTLGAGTSIEARMELSLALQEQIYQLRLTLANGDVETFKAEIKNIPEIKEHTEGELFKTWMPYAVASNDMDLVKWLNTNCADCALTRSGADVIHSIGTTYEAQPWRSMNSEMFKYVYDQGGVQHYINTYPNRKIVSHIASYWIPSGPPGTYGDYETRDADMQQDAARHQHRREMLSYLFEKGHDINELQEESNTTALFQAISVKDEPLIEFLLANGADPSLGDSPLATVTGNAELAYLQRLFDLGYDVNEITRTYYSSPSSTTLLGRVVEGSEFNLELLTFLEKNGVDFNLIDSRGKAPIDYAFREFGKAEQPYTNYLLERGATRTDQYYYSVLTDALHRSLHPIIEEVLSSHPKLAKGRTGNEKRPPLELARDTESAKLLLEAGAELHDNDNFTLRLLERAVDRENYELAQLLLDTRPTLSVNRTTTKDGQSIAWSRALQSASANGEIEWVNKLLKRGASIDGHDYSSYPIFGPALNGHKAVVQRLLDAGSITNPSSDGDSLFKKLEEYEGVEMLEFLRAYEKQ